MNAPLPDHLRARVHRLVGELDELSQGAKATAEILRSAGELELSTPIELTCAVLQMAADNLSARLETRDQFSGLVYPIPHPRAQGMD